MLFASEIIADSYGYVKDTDMKAKTSSSVEVLSDEAKLVMGYNSGIWLLV